MDQSKGPFSRAEPAEKKLKLFLYGPPGSGKTWTSIQFPAPVLIDLEDGAGLYAEKFGFDLLRTPRVDEISEAIDWLAEASHKYQTLVVDPVTMQWEAMQRRWSEIFLRRNTRSKGFKFEFYDFQPKDWMAIKAELKDFMRKVLALDMHIIFTAREKMQYADGQFMKPVGETFDGEKSLPYLFDIVLRVYRADDGRYMCHPVKDRTGRLPTEDFPNSIETFRELLDGRPAAVARRAVLQRTDHVTRIQELVETLGLPEEKVRNALSRYGAKDIGELGEENAKAIISKLEKQLEFTTKQGGSNA